MPHNVWCVITVGLFFSFTISVPLSTGAAPDTATEAECTVLRAAFGKTVECLAGKTAIDEPTRALLKTNLGKDAPYLFLKNNSAKGANTSCLDVKFVENIKAFMEATKEATGYMPVITDGYRGTAAQNRAAASGASGARACGSPHNYGMAVDFNGGVPKEVIRWMRAYAGSTRTNQTANHNIRTIGNPLTGCGLPAANGGSFCDPNHFELATWQDVRGECGRCGDAPGDGTQTAPPGGTQGLLANLMNMIRPQSQPPIAPFTSPLTATTPLLNSAFSVPVNTPTAPTPTVTTAIVGVPPKTSVEQLAELTAGKPATTTSSTTPTRPLATNNVIYLNEQKVALVPPVQVQPPQAYRYANPRGPESVVGFSSAQNILAPKNQTPTTFRDAYNAILNRIRIALLEILRLLRGEPPAQYYPEESWARYN